MKILHCIAQYPDRTGSAIYCQNLIGAWAKRPEVQAQALLYARNVEQPPPPIDVPGYEVVFGTKDLPFPLPGMSDVMPYASVSYHALKSEELTLWKQAFLAELQLALKEFQPDLLVCHHLWILTTLCRAAFPGPIMGICHGTDIRQAKQHPGLFRREVKGLAGLDQVIALTGDQLVDLQKLYGVDEERIHIGGGAFDPAVFHPREPHGEDPIRLIYAGRISDAKGVFEMVEAFKALPKDPAVELHLIAPTPEAIRHRILTQIEDDPRIQHYDVVNQRALAEIMGRGEIFLMPSYYEGLGLMAVEGLASGMRLVVTDLQPLKLFLRESLWQDERISVVPMPKLHDVDQIQDVAKAEHICRLKDAMAEQIYLQQKDRRPQEVNEAILALSWDGLASRLWTWAMAMRS